MIPGHTSYIYDIRKITFIFSGKSQKESKNIVETDSKPASDYDALIASYQNNGYLILNQFINSRTCEAVLSELDQKGLLNFRLRQEESNANLLKSSVLVKELLNSKLADVVGRILPQTYPTNAYILDKTIETN